MHTYVNKKGEKPSKTDIYSNGRFVDVKSVSIYFQEKIRKTFARAGKTPEWFFRLSFDATE